MCPSFEDSLCLPFHAEHAESTINKEKTDYTAKRNEWIDCIGNMFSEVRRMCFGRKEFIPEYGVVSERYQEQILSQMYERGEFYLKKIYYTSDNKTQVCRGDSCPTSAGYSMPTGVNSNIRQCLVDALKFNENLVKMSLKLPDGDSLVLSELFASTSLPSLSGRIYTFCFAMNQLDAAKSPQLC